MKNSFISTIILISLVGCVLASVFTPQGNIDLRDVYNITNVPYTNGTTANFSYYYGNGSQLTGVLTSINEGDLNVNSSNYWDDLDSYNSSELEKQADSNLGILDSFINILIDNRITQAFVKALGFYDNTEVYNKTETYNTSELFTQSDIIAFGYYNSSDFVITDYFTKSDIIGFDYYNNTNYPYTHLSNYTDDLGNRGYTHLSNFTNDAGYYNSSDFSISDYYTKVEILAFNYYNSSDFSISDYFTSAQILGFNYYNSTDFVITDYYTKNEIDNFNFYNITDFDINDYYLKSNPFGFLNVSVEELSSADDWIDVNSSTGSVQIDFNDSKLSTTYYNVASANAIKGTLSGTVDLTQHPDGNYDDITLNITEESGSPGLDIRFNFTGINGFSAGVMRYYTNDISGDLPLVQMWNYNSNSWEDYQIMIDSPTFATMTQPVFNSARHSQNNNSQMRIYKSSNGNINNHYYIDWVAVSFGYGVPSGEEVDPKSIHHDGTVPLTDNWNQGNYNLTNTDSWFLGKINWSSIKNILFSDFNYKILLDWANITNKDPSDFNYKILIKEANITDFGSYLTSESDPYWTANWSADQYLFNTGDTATGNYTFDTDTLHIDSSNDQVGIGTTTPGAKLHLSGSATADARQQFTQTTAGLTGQIQQGSTGFAISALGSQSMMFDTNGVQRMTIDSSGNVGIGTTSPAATLHTISTDADFFHATRIVSGSGNIDLQQARGTVASPTASSVGDSIGVNFEGYDGTAYRRLANIKATVVTNSPAEDDSPGDLIFSTTPEGTDVPTERLRIDSSGNVGIGTTTPNNKLDVAGNTSISGNFSVDGSTFFVDNTTNNVGIGDTTPSYKFQVFDGAGGGGSSTSLYGISQVDRTGPGTRYGGSVNQIFKAWTGAGLGTYGGITYRERDDPTTDFGKDGSLYFLTNSAASPDWTGGNIPSEVRMKIDGSGNVGIGTTDPSYPLEIKNSGVSRYVFHLLSSDGASLGGIYEDDSTNGEFYLKNASATIKVGINSAGDSYFNGGNVGIGTTSPDYKLQVNGSVVPETNATFDLGTSALAWDNVYAVTYNDLTPAWTESDGSALNVLSQITSKDGQILHESYPIKLRNKFYIVPFTYEKCRQIITGYQDVETLKNVTEIQCQNESIGNITQEICEEVIVEKYVVENQTIYSEECWNETIQESVQVDENLSESEQIGFVASELNVSIKDIKKFKYTRDIGATLTAVVESIRELFDWNTEQDDRIIELENEIISLKAENQIIKLAFCKEFPQNEFCGGEIGK